MLDGPPWTIKADNKEDDPDRLVIEIPSSVCVSDEKGKLGVGDLVDQGLSVSGGNIPVARRRVSAAIRLRRLRTRQPVNAFRM